MTVLDKTYKLAGNGTAKPIMAPNLEQAKAFLNFIDPIKNAFTFQTFDDSERKDKSLAKVLNGTLDEHATQLAELNSQGAGIFVTVNETDLKGRKTDNIKRVRAVFADTDGAPLEPIQNHSATPNGITNSSKGKWHAYWLNDDLPLDEFSQIQSNIVAKFSTDPSVKDLPRVMRLPGFYHRKAAPFMVTFKALTHSPYSANQIRRAFPTPPPLSPIKGSQTTSITTNNKANPYTAKARDSALTAVMTAPEGQRNETLNREAFGLFGLVKGGHLDEQATHDELERAAVGAGLAHSEIRATLKSAWHSAQPRTIESNDSLPTISPSLLNEFTAGDQQTIQNDPQLLFNLAEHKAANLLQSNPPPRRYVVEGFLPEPIAAAIVAPGSTGKSFFLMQLAASVAAGVPFFGLGVKQIGGVLMLAAEDDQDELSRRLHSIKDHLTLGFSLTDEQEALLGENFYPVTRLADDNRLTHKTNGAIDWNHALINSIVRTSNEIPNLRLIILDPVARFRAGDENANEDATKFVEALEAIRKQTGVTVLCAHHSRKGGTGESADDIRGASAFVDALRFAATLYSPSVEDAKKLGIDEDERRSWVRMMVVKSNYKTDIDSQWYRRSEGGVLALTKEPQPMPTKAANKGEERYQAALPKLRELIRKADERGEPLTRKKLNTDYAGSEGIFGMSDKSLRAVVQRALDEGQITLKDAKLRLY